MDFSLFVAITLTLSEFAYGSKEIKMPPGCEGLPYCTIQPDDYSKYAGEMDRAIKASKYWTGIGAIYSQMNFEPMYTPTDGSNCGSITNVEQPFIIRALVNSTNPEKLVVQSKLFTQKIPTTSCIDKTFSCFEEMKAQQNSFETKCDESYSTVTLYVFEDGEITPQPFKIPVACTCKVFFKS